MRIKCPMCGERDLREFSYRGAASDMVRPDADADARTWDDFVHLRENPAGATCDLWYHEGGCSAWIVVERNTVTHEIVKTKLAAKSGRAQQ